MDGIFLPILIAIITFLVISRFRGPQIQKTGSVLQRSAAAAKSSLSGFRLVHDPFTLLPPLPARRRRCQ